MRIEQVRVLACCLPWLVGALQAQHDPQRDATKAIAAGDFAEMEKVLAKAEADDPETRFVRMMAELARDELKAAVVEAKAALDAGLPFSRLQAGPRELLGKLHATPEFAEWRKQAGAEGLKLLHGPMLGSVTDSSAAVWVRTVGPAELRLRIGERLSAPVKSSADSDFTAVAVIDGLEAATDYAYEVLLDGEPAAKGPGRLRTFPKAGAGAEFAVAFGGGAGYVPKWERMWDRILGFDPLAMLMLGDNVYIDDPEHLLTHHYCYHRRQERPEWRRLTASTAMAAIYDDHDFGLNDCVPGPKIESPPWKRKVWEVFRQNWANPAYGGGEEQPGCWFDFHIGDVHFILLDGRYYRDRKSGSMLGPVQKAWLKQTLKGSKGTFKVLASPVPWTANIKPGSKDPWDGYPKEREEIFSFIEDNRIEGVFLVAADRHRTDLRTTERKGSYTLYEFESSKLTNRHTHKVIRTPGLIWGHNESCSFGLMKFDTTKDDPAVVFECVDIDGKVVHSHTLKRSALGR